MKSLTAKQALLPDGWRENIRIDVGADGRIANIRNATEVAASSIGILLPAPTNLHSHAFQRAAAGMTERRGPDPQDSFWTWRQQMYRFLDHLTPDDVQNIAALVQMEMLEAGYAAVAEFHYLHHQPGGQLYDNIGEMSDRIAAAAADTGIGLTLLPVLYRYGGCDRRPLGKGQIRFGCTQDQFAKVLNHARKAITSLPSDARIGIAPHSLRAVAPDDLAFVTTLMPEAPLHMHLAEQVAEVDEVQAYLSARPTQWLLDNQNVDSRWCLIHCTQLVPEETKRLAESGAVVGLCPITESSLGDGIFDGVRFAECSGRFGIGSDSNIRISLSEELRTFEYSQRLRDRGRALLAKPDRSTGRVLYDAAVLGGAAAAGRPSGAITVGAFADLMALDCDAVDLSGKRGDDVLDSYIFAGDDRMVSDVWSAGRHVVKNGQHIHRERIVARYRQTMSKLRA
ncbi:MAG: formimidoylglutamate deiminase [Hyphomicrobiaceae bacterium]|nr:formimidoylglutamate deiminase [Hyphomicrobiaceae bacterium]